MSANIFIIFPIEVQCWSMAQRVVQRLFFFFPMTFSKHFKQKSLRLANLQLRTALRTGRGRRETIIIRGQKKIKAAQLLNDNGSNVGK